MALDATLTAPALWKWASRRARAAEAAGRGTECPTLREAARRFRCSMDDVEDAAGGDPGDDRYLGLAVAVGTPGGGAAELQRPEWLVEAY